MNCIKRLILICENCGEKMFDEINVNYEGDLLLMKVGTCACSSMTEFVKANTELAKLTANMIEFLTEVSYKPYKDSDALSLLESLRTRASVILQDIGKDEPLTLTNLPRLMTDWYWQIRKWCEQNIELAEMPTNFIAPLAREIEQHLAAEADSAIVAADTFCYCADPHFGIVESCGTCGKPPRY